MAARKKAAARKTVTLDDLEPIAGVSLSNDQLRGNVTIVGRAVFPNLDKPDGPPGSPPKWGLQTDVEKGTASAQRLFATINHIARKVWPDDAKKRSKIPLGIKQGLGGMDGSKVSVYDGDLMNPQWSGGMWCVGARAAVDDRAEGRGQPMLLVREKGGVRRAKDASEYPKHGDGVSVVIDVWAQPARDRVNLRCLAVVREVSGVAQVGAPTAEQIAEAVTSQLSELPPPDEIPGVIAAFESPAQLEASHTVPQAPAHPVEVVEESDYDDYEGEEEEEGEETLFSGPQQVEL